MIEKILNFKSYIYVGVASFLLATAISAPVTYKLTKDHYEAKIATIEKNKALTINAQTALKANHNQSVSETKDSNRAIADQHNEKTRKIDNEKTVAASNAKNVRDSMRRGTDRVWRDPGKTASAAACINTDTGKNGRTTETVTANSGELSAKTREFLYEYGYDAEVTRVDLQAQYDYALSLYTSYNRMRDEYITLIDKMNKNEKEYEKQVQAIE